MAKASGGGEQLSDVANFALGKQPYRYDERTLRLGLLMAPEQPPPASFDADKGKKPFPLEMWGNDAYGDCVFVAGANGLIRLERAESRRTLPIKEDTVLAKYKALTGCESPGDANDEGFVMLDAFRDWRNSGWQVGKKSSRSPPTASLTRRMPISFAWRSTIWAAYTSASRCQSQRSAKQIRANGMTSAMIAPRLSLAPGADTPSLPKRTTPTESPFLRGAWRSTLPMRSSLATLMRRGQLWMISMGSRTG
jgi:hypothetical protein